MWQAVNCLSPPRRNANVDTFDAASHSSFHEPVRSPQLTFAPNDPFDFHEAGKSAECRQGVVSDSLSAFCRFGVVCRKGWLDDDKSGAEDKGPSEDYTFFGVDLKPLLPSGSCCLNCDWWPVHAPGADSDVVSFHHPIAGVRWFMALSWGAWRIVPLLILGKSKRCETWNLVLLVAWTSRRGCRGVHTSRGNIPVLSAAMIIIVE